MISNKLIVVGLPLEKIWKDNEIISGKKLKNLDEEDIRDLLREVRIQFVVANTGSPLLWIPVENCFDFFKNELRGKISNNEADYSENYSENYFYYASIWKTENKIPIVLLEKNH